MHPLDIGAHFLGLVAGILAQQLPSHGAQFGPQCGLGDLVLQLGLALLSDKHRLIPRVSSASCSADRHQLARIRRRHPAQPLLQMRKPSVKASISTIAVAMTNSLRIHGLGLSLRVGARQGAL